MSDRSSNLDGNRCGNLFGGVGVAVGVTLNVIVFFVLAEAVPKTYAVLNPDRAAMIAARPVRAHRASSTPNDLRRLDWPHQCW